MASSPIISWQIDMGKVETVPDFIFLGSKIADDSDSSHEIKTHAPWMKSYDKPQQCIKKHRHHFADKRPYSQSYDFFSRKSDLSSFQGKAFKITVIQVYAPTADAEAAQVEWFYEDLQDLLELTPKKDVLFLIGVWNAKVGSQRHLE